MFFPIMKIILYALKLNDFDHKDYYNSLLAHANRGNASVPGPFRSYFKVRTSLF